MASYGAMPAWLRLVVCTMLMAASVSGAIAAAQLQHSTKLPTSTTVDDITIIKVFQDFQDRSCTTVFGPSPVSGSAVEFGQGKVFDYPVTALDESGTVQQIGRSRGIHIYESLDADGVHEMFTISFFAGDFAGSSLTFSGHGVAVAILHELPVTGGTGVFKFARGSGVYQQEHQDSTNYSVELTLKDVLLPGFRSS